LHSESKNAIDMARQKGVILLEGKVGNLSFYKNQGSYLARTKGGVDGNRIKNDPAFVRTRENGSEFGRAGQGGKLLRNALRLLLLNSADNRVASRLTKEMVKVVKSDTTHSRGERTVADGDLNLLEGFEFNNRSKLGTTLFMPYTKSIDRATGEFELDIPAFVPKNMVAAPAGATHMKFHVAGVGVDFANESFEEGTASSSEVVIGAQNEPAITVTASISAGSTAPLFMAVGVEFLQEVSGQQYPLKNGAYNAISLVALDV
jgi:hypothetical protein